MSTLTLGNDSFLDSLAPQTFQERAELLLQRGVPVIPLLPKSKEPATKHAARDASTDPAVIRRWVKTHSAGNCAGVARYDGFWMLDDDAGTLAEKYKADTGQDFPRTFTVQTSRGFHYYFLHDEVSRLVRYGGASNSGVIEIPGYKGEARCNNQYVVGPGSRHPSGAVYEICDASPIIAAPVQLLARLQEAYESCKSDSKKPSGNEIKSEGDSGFKRLFDTVGYRPLLNRINALDDVRLHATELVPGQTIPCPLHKHADCTPCFGPLAEAPNLFHCLGNCGWSGDMVAACYEVDGGRKKYQSMYACAKAICEEEALDFDDFFPPKPASPAEVNEPTQTVSSELVRPTLNETAYYGLAGRIVKKLEPCTESHPAGLLFELLLSFGNLIGRCAYYQVEDTRHYTNECMAKVGETSRSRKGTGKNRIRSFIRDIDLDWLNQRCMSSPGSGEAVIHQVRDPQIKGVFNKRTGKIESAMVDEGIADKRLCINIGEFQSLLSVAHRADNTLSSILRDAWDGVPLHNVVKHDPAHCVESLISVMADITLADLTSSLTQADRNNGFANRFLWVYVYRTKLLPEGGDEIDWLTEKCEMRDAVEFSRGLGRVFMDKATRDRWGRTVYPKLERDIPGLVGAITARASAHTMRLALLYALLDKSEHIRLEHLEAAEALWQYCEDSAQAIFGDLLSLEQAKIIEFLSAYGPATKKDIIHKCFQGHRKANLIQADLDLLRSRNLVAMSETDVPQYRAVGRSERVANFALF